MQLRYRSSDFKGFLFMAQQLLPVVIEDPKGSLEHREFNSETQTYEVVQRFTIPWPFHYGYIKGTRVEVDRDPLDIAIFSTVEAQIGQEMVARIIGALFVQDGDHKIFGVCQDDSQFGQCMEYTDIAESLRVEGENIFKKGGHIIEKVFNAEDALELIEQYRT